MSDMRIGIGLDISDLVTNAQTAKSTIESLNRAMSSSLKSGNIEDVKSYSAVNLEARNKFIKDARIGGYSDKVSLDSGGLQEHIKNLETNMKQMISEGKAKEAKEYASLVESFRSQFASEQIDRPNFF